MAMTWKLGLLNLSPRLLNFHNPDRVFSDKPSLDSPSGEPPLIPPRRSFSLSSLIQAKLPKFSGSGETGETGETGREERGLFSQSLHQSRIDSIRETLCHHFRRNRLSARPFEGLKFIAVGCGGGIVSESLAQLGATVTGIDAVEEKIKKARLHAELDPVTSRIEYRCTTAAKLVEEQKSFDAVLALEVIQHVENPAEFCKSLSALTVSDGAIMMSFTEPYFIVIIASILLDWSLAQMGATVTGIDAVEEKIKKARLHAELDPVTSRIEYHCTTAEKLVEEQKSFDAVLALEVIQHMENPDEFCKSLSALTVPDGAIMISFTRAYAIVIIASFLLHFRSNVTHRFSVFDTSDLIQFLERASISFQGMAVCIPHFRRANFIAFCIKTAK